MTIIQALFLGILQGLTEFLPISSSGHLVLAEHLFLLPADERTLQGFDVILHAGTLVALILCYAGMWKELLFSLVRKGHRYRPFLIAIIVATIPAVIVGFLFQDFIASSLRSPITVGLSLLVTALVLLLGERFQGHQIATQTTRMQAFWIGCAQACALVPGLSRSGLTISAGRAVDLSRKEALDFSFLMAMPVIAGAALLTFLDVLRGDAQLPGVSVLTVGFISSFVVSIGAIFLIRRWVATHSLSWFVLYLIPVGLLVVASGMNP